MKALTLPAALIHKRRPSLAFLILFLPVSIYSQKIRSEEITYSYPKLPLQPLDPSIKNYTARIDAPYDEKN